jgi:FkbM family methyltransferase
MRRFRLPDGRRVAGMNRLELRFLYDEIIRRRVYLRRGIVVGDGDVVFDVGANIGLFALDVAAQAPGARIVAFEPMPLLFTTLAANAAAYFPAAQLRNVALGATEGHAIFTYYPRCSGWSTAHPDPEGLRAGVGSLLPLPRFASDLLVDWLAKAETIERPVTTLSHALQQSGMPRIDLLKIDAERAEHDILRGIDAADWPRVRQIVVETQDAQRDAVASLLREHGYNVTVEQDDVLAGTDYHLVYAR